MKNLIIKIGNTSTVVALLGKKIKLIASFGSNGKLSEKYLNRIMQEIFTADYQNIAIVSVVPHLTSFWFSTCKKNTHKPIFVLSGENCGEILSLKYPKAKLGADRIANALGAVLLFPGQSRIIIDVGTAVTIDAVSSKNEFLGGIIMPGISLCLAAMDQGTGQLPLIHYKRVSRAIGNNTKECMRLGSLYSVAGGIRFALEQIIAKERFTHYQIVTTGGGWLRVRDFIKEKIIQEPHLLLYGADYWLARRTNTPS